jgi:putative nucleotidyltransferase with HDIG domain
MATAEELIKEIHTLKPLPQVAIQIITLGEDPRSSVSDIADVVLYDPGVTATILKLCNSAFFSLPRKVESIRDAICFLGMNQIIDLVLLKGSAENMLQDRQGYGFHEGELWRYAVSSALIAKELARKKGYKNTHLIFTAALLKDIGKVILDRYVSDSFEKIENLVEEKGYSFREAEKEILGIDHAELGALVAKIWKFSDKMTYIITNHHMSDESAKEDFETSIVYLADTVCNMMGMAGESEGLAQRFYEEVLNRLKISHVDLQDIMAGFIEDMGKVENLIGAAQTPW